jgi:hypothetical protein
MLVVGITTLHDQGLFCPTTVRGWRVAALGPRASSWRSSGRSAITMIGCVSMLSMSFPAAHGLANAINAVRGERHDTGHLLDFELLARPAEAFVQRADWGHRGTARTTGAHAAHAARAASSAALAAAASPTPAARATTARTTRAAGPRDRGVDQSLRIIAVRLVELPASAEIDARGRRLRELFARARCETQRRHNHDYTHAAIL